MGMLLGAMAGAGDYIAGAMRDNARNADAIDLEKLRATLAEDKAKSIAQFQAGLNEQAAVSAQQRADAPLQRFGGLVQAMQGNELPVAPAPVTALSGAGTAFDGKPLTQEAGGGAGAGFQGSPEAMRAAVLDIKDPVERANALKQLESQIAADNQKAKDDVAGKTRKPTTEEAVEMARAAALASDPVALAAYEAKIGKPARDDRRLDISEKRAQDANEWNQRRADRQDAMLALREANAETRQKIQDGKLDSQMARAELQSQRQAVTELMKSTEHELERMAALGKDPTLDPAIAKMYQERVAKLTTDLSRYKSALETFSGGSIPAAGAPAPQAPPPDGTRGTLNGVPGVVRNGQFVPDKATTPSPAPVAAPASAPAAPSPAAALPAAAVPAQDANIAARADQENLEMGEGKRMQFSPEVKAYMERKTAADRAEAEARNRTRSDAEFKRQQELRKARGY